MPLFTAIAAGAAAFGTWFAAQTILTQFAIRLAAGWALNKISKALAGKPPKPRRNGITGEMGQGADIPRSFILGQFATRGSLVYHNSWGGSENDYYTRITALSDLPVAGLAYLWIDGVRVEIDFANPDPNFGFPLIGYSETQDRVTFITDPLLDGAVRRVSVNETVNYGWVKFYDGTQTTADPFVVNTVSTAERPWTAQDVGVGVAYAICTFRINERLFKNFPDIMYVVNGINLFDPATGTVGTGNNVPIVQVYNLLSGLEYAGNWFYGSQANPNILTTGLNDAINACKAPVPGASSMNADQRIAAFGSTTIPPRYTSAMEVFVNEPVADIIEEILGACNGRATHTGIGYRLQVGDPESAVLTISDDDILTDYTQMFTPFMPLDESINGITATYIEPREGWSANPAPAIFNPVFEARDDNRRLVRNIPFETVTTVEQAERLMNLALNEALNSRRHVFSLPARFAWLTPGEYIEYTSVRNGYTSKLFRVESLSDLPNGDVVVEVIERDPNDYDWDASLDFMSVDFGDAFRQINNGVSMSGLSVAPAIGYDGESGPRRPGVAIFWDAANNPNIVGVRWEIRTANADQILVASGSTSDVDLGGTILTEGLAPNSNYEIRLQYVTTGYLLAVWSSWFPFTTPDVRLSAAELDDVLQLEITTAVNDAQNAVEQSQRALDLVAFSLDGGWLADPAFAGWDAGNLLDDNWSVRVNVPLFAVQDVPNARLTSSILIDRPSGSSGTAFQIAASSADGMIGADPAADFVVASILVEYIEGSAGGPRLRAEWFNGTDWAEGDAFGLAEPAGTFTQWAIPPRPGVIQGKEVMFLRPAGYDTAVRLFFELGTAVGGRQYLRIHSMNLREATETEITAFLAPDQLEAVEAEVFAAQTAITTLEGNASASFVLRQRAGEAVGSLEAVAASNPDGTALSTFSLDYDFIDIEGRVRLSDLVVTDLAGNVMVNGDFRQGDLRGWATPPNGWSVIARDTGSGFTAVSTMPFPFALETDNDPLSNQIFYQDERLSCGPGDRFTISYQFAAKTTTVGGSASASFGIQAQWLDAAGAEISVSTVGVTNNTSGAWQSRAPTAVQAPAGAASVRFRAYVLAGTTGRGVLGNIRIDRQRDAAILIRPNSITGAQLIQTDVLISNSAQMGSLVVDTANIRDLTVTTLKIADGAVTGTGASFSGMVGLSSAGWTNMAIVSIGTLGSRVMVVHAQISSVSGSGGSEGVPGFGVYRVLVNGTPLYQTPTVGGGEIPILAIATSSAGATTLTVQGIKTGGDGNFSGSARIVGTELKK